MADNPSVKMTPAPAKQGEAGKVDTSASANKKEVVIGSVKDALQLQATETYKPHPETEPVPADEKESQPVTSLAQLREVQIANNVPALERSKQRDEVAKLEKEIEKEGSKHARLSSAASAARAQGKK